MIPLPKNLLVCPWGKSVSITGQPIIVDDSTVKGFRAFIAAHGCEEIPLDFEHNSHVADVQQAQGKPQDPVRVAAYGAPSIIPGKGIVLDLDPDKWTDEGRDYYQGQHYRDVSPVLAFADDGTTVVGITSVALCRRGAIPRLTAFNAQLNNPIANMENDTTDTSAKKPTGATAEDQLKVLSTAIVELLKNYGVDVPEGATLEQIMQAVADAKSKSKEDKSSPTTPETKAFSANSEITLEAFSALQSKVDTLAADNEKVEKKLLIEQAKTAGKAIPLKIESLMAYSVSQLTELLDSLPAGTVPFSAPATAGATPAQKVLTAEEQSIARSMGLTDEEFLQGLK